MKDTSTKLYHPQEAGACSEIDEGWAFWPHPPYGRGAMSGRAHPVAECYPSVIEMCDRPKLRDEELDNLVDKIQGSLEALLADARLARNG
jgi:hypothetical protein